MHTLSAEDRRRTPYVPAPAANCGAGSPRPPATAAGTAPTAPDAQITRACSPDPWETGKARDPACRLDELFDESREVIPAGDDDFFGQLPGADRFHRAQRLWNQGHDFFRQSTGVAVVTGEQGKGFHGEDELWWRPFDPVRRALRGLQDVIGGVHFDGGKGGGIELQAFLRIRAHDARVELSFFDEVGIRPGARPNVDLARSQMQRLRAFGNSQRELRHRRSPSSLS